MINSVHDTKLSYSLNSFLLKAPAGGQAKPLGVLFSLSVIVRLIC